MDNVEIVHQIPQGQMEKHTGDGGKPLKTYLVRNQPFEFL